MCVVFICFHDSQLKLLKKILSSKSLSLCQIAVHHGAKRCIVTAVLFEVEEKGASQNWLDILRYSQGIKNLGRGQFGSLENLIPKKRMHWLIAWFWNNSDDSS